MGEWELDGGREKVHSSSYKLNKYKDVMYNLINIINTAVCYVRKLLRVNPKSSSHGKDVFL